MNTDLGYTFEYTNECSCTAYDEDTDTYVEMDYCDGHCWEMTIEDFSQITEKLFDNNPTLWWRVSNLRLWNGDVSGYFFAKNATELLRGMTVDSDWTMRGELTDTYIQYSLSHHDAPMGSSSRLTIVTDEEREELGLY